MIYKIKLKKNNMEIKKTRNKAMSIMKLIGIVFVILKLYDVITWSWWLVTLPFWIGYATILFASFLVLLIVMVFSLFN